MPKFLMAVGGSKQETQYPECFDSLGDQGDLGHGPHGTPFRTSLSLLPSKLLLPDFHSHLYGILLPTPHLAV